MKKNGGDSVLEVNSSNLSLIKVVIVLVPSQHSICKVVSCLFSLPRTSSFTSATIWLSQIHSYEPLSLYTAELIVRERSLLISTLFSKRFPSINFPWSVLATTWPYTILQTMAMSQFALQGRVTESFKFTVLIMIPLPIEGHSVETVGKENKYKDYNVYIFVAKLNPQHI